MRNCNLQRRLGPLGHTTNKEIHDTIPYVKGLEGLVNKVYQQHTKCASCMIRKSALEDFPELRTRAEILLSK
jgi:hypothetical protein